MQKYYLSKSDFKVARTCSTKLYYRKKGYPNKKEANDYLEFLAQGGYMVGKLATLLYPKGIEIETGDDQEKALELTEKYMQEFEVTLFEPAFLSKGKLIRVDILEKIGNVIKLIEVKSKSWDSTKPPKRNLEPYLEDVTFQYVTLSELYPTMEIKPFLFMPDKSKRSNVEGLNQIFEVKEVITRGKFKHYEVAFDESRIEDIYDEVIMTRIDVSSYVQDKLNVVNEALEEFLPSLENELNKLPPKLRKDCFDCEFCLSNEKFEKSGFQECWGDIKQPEAHIKDLYKVGTVKDKDKKPVIEQLIKDRKLSLFDFPEMYFYNKKNKMGKESFRRKIQIDYTKKNKEWISKKLKPELESWQYPLCFIDFENTLTALPFHKGMFPYEPVLFQWSCHILRSPGAVIEHYEFLNTEAKFPNFKFAEALMETVGEKGTFLMWHTHENTMLKNIFEQIEKYNFENQKLKNWLSETIKFDKKDIGRFKDMNVITREMYFHPDMKGQTSIKKVLPAVLKASKSERIKYWLENFEEDLSLFQLEEKENYIIDPYQLLPTIDLFENKNNGKQTHVSEGTEAMRVYDEMLFGVYKDNIEAKENYKKALLRYCKLDTLAMVIIWEHWRNLT